MTNPFRLSSIHLKFSCTFLVHFLYISCVVLFPPLPRQATDFILLGDISWQDTSHIRRDIFAVSWHFLVLLLAREICTDWPLCHSSSQMILITWDGNVKAKEDDKLTKYAPLEAKIQESYQVRTETIPILVGAQLQW